MRCTIRALALLAGLSSACGEGPGEALDGFDAGAGGPGACALEISPTRLDLGPLAVGASADGEIVVRNRSDVACTITAVDVSTLEGAIDVFDVSFEADVELPAGASATLNVAARPTVGLHRARVVLRAAHLSVALAEIELVVRGERDIGFVVAPDRIDFGAVQFGCSARARQVTAYNLGPWPVTIDAFRLDSLPGVFSLSGLPDTPFVLQGGSFQFDVHFLAPERGDFSGQVEMDFTMKGRSETLRWPLRGGGAALEPRVRDELWTPQPLDLDILFIVDPAMGSPGFDPAGRAADFIRGLDDGYGDWLDFQVGVVSAAPGAGAPQLYPLGASREAQVATRDGGPSAAAVVAEAMASVTSTASENHAIDVLERAVTQGVVDGSGESFFRDEAHDVPLRRWIIILTPRADDTDRDLNEVSSSLLQVLRFGRLDLVSGRERGCAGDGTAAEASPRLVALADEFPGRSFSICEGWSAPLSKLDWPTWRSRWFLQNRPVISSIEMELDGEEAPARAPDGGFNWSYSFSTNSVFFFPPPRWSQTLVATYFSECL